MCVGACGACTRVRAHACKRLRERGEGRGAEGGSRTKLNSCTGMHWHVLVCTGKGSNVHPSYHQLTSIPHTSTSNPVLASICGQPTPDQDICQKSAVRVSHNKWYATRSTSTLTLTWNTRTQLKRPLGCLFPGTRLSFQLTRSRLAKKGIRVKKFTFLAPMTYPNLRHSCQFPPSL